MTDEGPTTVGSIVAKLKMDRDQWLADKDRTKADARELGALNPTIRIDVDTSRAMAQIEALRVAAESAGVINPGQITPAGPSGPSAGTAAKIDSVAAAEARLAAAESLSESATQRAILAEMRLDEVRSKGKKTAVQLAAAEFAASEAVKKSEAAAAKAIAAEDALAVAQKKAAAAALEQAASEEVDTKAKDKGNAANKTNVTRIGLIIAGVSALVAMGAPLAGFTLGVAGGLTGMGSAGVLAVLGIRREMALGTATGSAYSAGIQVLLGDLHQLEATATAGVLTGFTGAVSILDSAMPSLNSQVGLFSKMLGTGVDISLRGVVNTFQVLNPLFVTSGVFVNQLAAGFLSWTSNGGLQKFASYAMATLPVVEQTLGALANGAVHLIGALAPLGVVMLGALTIIGNVVTGLTMLLGPAFAPITAAVLLTLGAFKAWAAIEPIIKTLTVAVGKFGLATLTMWGAVGLAVAAIGYLASAWIGSSAAADTATASTQSYTAALQQDNGVIGEHVKLQAASNLQSAGAFTAADKLGIATEMLTKAALGNHAAMKAVNASLDGQSNALKGLIDDQRRGAQFGNAMSLSQAGVKREVDATRSALATQRGAIKAAIKSYNDLAAAQGLTSISTKAQLQAVQDNANTYHMSVPAYMAAQAAQKQTADQLRITTQNMYYQNDAAGLLKMALDKLNGVAISAASSQNAFDSSLANSNTHIDATGKTINRATVSLDGMSAAAVANRGELIGQVTAAHTAGEAFRNMTDANGNLINSTEAGRQKLIDMKQQILDNAVAHGEDRDAVQQYIDKIFAIPKVPPVKFDADTSAAMANIAALAAAVASVDASLAAAPAAARTSVGVDLSRMPVSGVMAKFSTPVAKHAGGGTIQGPGSSTSDSVPIWASAGEEMIRASSAGFDRPFLKAYNANPARALAAVAAPPQRANKTVHLHIYPSPGMDETAIGAIAGRAVNRELRK